MPIMVVYLHSSYLAVYVESSSGPGTMHCCLRNSSSSLFQQAIRGFLNSLRLGFVAGLEVPDFESKHLVSHIIARSIVTAVKDGAEL